MFGAVGAIYAMADGLPHAQLAALSFTALVAGNLGLILLYRSGGSLWQSLRQPNPAFWIVAVGALALLGAVTWLASPSRWFGFAPPPTGLWLLALALPLAFAGLLGFLQNRLSAPPGQGP
jgi:Ca2+-transporting ATPase